MKNAKLKNNICFVLDSSGSMSGLREDVIKIFNKQIENMIEKSKANEQETRVSVYTFDDNVKNICWDTDCLRSPSIEEFYKTGGLTAMVAGTMQAIEDLKKIPEIYGDYSNLIIVISDGENNLGGHLASRLRSLIGSLPSNWTVAFLGPDSNAINQAVSYGFQKGNCQLWSTTSKGALEVGKTLQAVTDNFMANRTKGIRSTSSLFALNTAAISKAAVVSNLDALKSKDYNILHVRKGDDGKAIKSFIEDTWKMDFVQGSAYYQLSKKEKVQANKNILIKDKKNGKVYGGAAARQMLGLPDQEVRVDAAQHPDFLLFIQSNSINRKLVANTELIILK